MKRLILTAVASAAVTYLVVQSRRTEPQTIERIVFFDREREELREEERGRGSVEAERSESAQPGPTTRRRFGLSRIRKCFATPKAALLSSAALAIAIIVSSAVAAWLVSGSGPANSATPGVPTITVTAPTTAPTDASCVPGNSCDLAVDVSTGGVAGWSATSFSVALASNVTTSNTTNCPASNFSRTTAHASGATVNLPAPVSLASSGLTRVVLPDVFQMSAAAPIGCASITYSVSSPGATVNASPTGS